MTTPTLENRDSQQQTHTSTSAQGGSGNKHVQLKSSLRRANYDQGAAALAPVQMRRGGQKKGGDEEFEDFGPNAGYSKVHPKFREKKENYHESLLPGGKMHAQREEQKYAVTTGTLKEFFQSIRSGGQQVVAGLLRNTVGAVAPEGGGGLIEAAGTLKLPFVEVESKFGLEITLEADGKLQTKGKMEFGTALKIPLGELAIFSAGIKAALAGAYEVKAVGRDMNECMRLIEVAMELSMNNAAAEVEASTQEQEAVEAAKKKDKGLWQRFCGFIGYVWNRMSGNVARWSLKQVLNVLWVGEGGMKFDDRLALALEEIEEGDSVEVKREDKRALGAELTIGNDKADHGKAALTYENVDESVTKLDNASKATVAADHKSATQKAKKHVGVATAEINLNKVAGLKGKLEYKHERESLKPEDAPKRPAGELVFETTVAISGFSAAITGAAIGIWSHVGKWFETAQKESNSPSSLGGSEAVISGGLVTGYEQVFNTIGSAATNGAEGKDYEVTVIWKWVHNNEHPFHWASVEVKTMKVLTKSDDNTKLFGYGFEGAVKTGAKQNYMAKDVEKLPALKKPYDRNQPSEAWGSE